MPAVQTRSLLRAVSRSSGAEGSETKAPLCEQLSAWATDTGNEASARKDESEKDTDGIWRDAIAVRGQQRWPREGEDPLRGAESMSCLVYHRSDEETEQKWWSLRPRQSDARQLCSR